MNVSKYVNDHDTDLPLLTEDVGNPDVKAALAEQNEQLSRQRVSDIRGGLDACRARATDLQRGIARLKQQRKGIERQIADYGGSRDENRIALALLTSGQELTAAQRFGIFGLVVTHELYNLAPLRKIYGTDADADQKAIVMAAANLLADGELEALRAQGF